MKKLYKLLTEHDELNEVDNLPETIEEIDDDSIWLDTGEKTVQLPAEIAKYLESDGILGIA